MLEKLRMGMMHGTAYKIASAAILYISKRVLSGSRSKIKLRLSPNIRCFSSHRTAARRDVQTTSANRMNRRLENRMPRKIKCLLLADFVAKVG
jgi:hypothetical protein